MASDNLPSNDYRITSGTRAARGICDYKETLVREPRFRLVAAGLIIALSACPSGAAETRTIENGLEVHDTLQILDPAEPTHIVTPESCVAARSGWKIVPDSVRTEVITARMTDPGGDPDWKTEKAEAHARLDADETRLCLWAYCQGPLQFQCEIQARASWRESN